MANRKEPVKYSFKEVSSELWPAFEALFGENGACGGCWCQWWRVSKGGKTWDATKGSPAKKMMKKLFMENRVTGLLAFNGEKAVGWCSYGPRIDYPRLEGMKAYRREDMTDVTQIWCINCFFIERHYRREGLARMMLEAAVKYIKKRRVKIIEAYPTPRTKDGQKLPAAFVYTGPLEMFEAAGFKIIQRHSHSRPLVELKL
nr:GNAT family N-acetyltransferase [candidate division Zixibacteria bacterium]